MKLKHIALMSIAVLSLSGSLYGMDYYKVRIQLFNAVENCDIDAVERILGKDTKSFTPDMNINRNALLTKAILIDRDEAKNKNRPALVKKILQLIGSQDIQEQTKGFLSFVIGLHSNDLNCKKLIIHLLCSAGAPMDFGATKPYKQDGFDALKAAEISGNNEIVAIIQNYIHTRLSTAIFYGDANEVRRLITKYDININGALPSYGIRFNFSSTTAQPHESSFIPLHDAVRYNQNDVARLLINEFNVDVTIQDNNGCNALHHESNFEIAQLLIAKGCNPNLADNNGAKPIDWINDMLTPESLHEIGHQTERVENFRALKAIFEGRPYIPGNNPPVTNNNGGPQPDPINPANNPPVIGNNNGGPLPDPVDPTVITNNAFSWKWIGGGAVVIVAVVAAKKLYNWWYKDAEVAQEKTSEVDAEHNGQQEEDAGNNAL